jgi:exosome complex RNA-binding protein Rrp4
MPTTYRADASGTSDAKSEFYQPEERDIVLAAVLSSNDDELELEIGAQFPAVMPFREFQPFPQIIENTFFKLPDNDRSTHDRFVPPGGRVLLVEDKTVNDGSYTEGVRAGTVVLAEVQGRALTDGRAILSCRLPARRLSWNRIAQVCL